MENGLGPVSQSKKKRGRPPGTKKTTEVSPVLRQKRSNKRASIVTSSSGQSSKGISVGLNSDEEEIAYAVTEERASELSQLLQSILRHDRAEITRVARALEVAENTVYRWINGSSDPRLMHLKRLPEVLPEHRHSLIYTINQAFPGALDNLVTGIREVPKEIYSHVLELVALTPEEDTRFWQASQAIFECALLQLDVEHQGLVITFARLMPPHEDGIHSLRESASRGNDPWPFSIESKAFLGSTTLAGTAATLQRLQIWDIADSEDRLQVEVDEFEKSACAIPVMRGGEIGGVLIVSSTCSGFFSDPMACQAVREYAQLLAVTLRDEDFQPYALINLRPMPDLRWQRAQLASSYVSRIIAYAQTHEISRQQAEHSVRMEMELEFEELGCISLERNVLK